MPPPFPGQFYHGINYEVTDLRPGKNQEKPDATMYVKGHELDVTRYINVSVWKRLHVKCI